MLFDYGRKTDYDLDVLPQRMTTWNGPHYSIHVYGNKRNSMGIVWELGENKRNLMGLLIGTRGI
jgi:hypothetical protein